MESSKSQVLPETNIHVDDHSYFKQVACNQVDDDGHPKRTGTFWTCSAYIVTTVVGSGVLSLPWAFAQLGWLVGSSALIIFSAVAVYASRLLSDSYRSPDPETGRRNYTYNQAVEASLGGWNAILSGIAQYTNLVFFSVGFIVTSSTSMMAIKRSNCFHEHGHDAGCHELKNAYIIMYGIIQVFVSQVPNFRKLSFVTTVSTCMCLSHASIGFGLSMARVAGGMHGEINITGVPIGADMSVLQKVLKIFTAMGNMSFAFSFAEVLIEIQDTLKSSPPENQVMKRASFTGITLASIFYMSYGLVGYVAFGYNAPGNILAGFGFYDPFWLVDLANICVVVHLAGAYQISSQPVFAAVEKWCTAKWPNAKHLYHEYSFGFVNLTFLRLVWRTLFVAFTTLLALMFPFFNDMVGLLGAISFCPLTVYFPCKMHIKRRNIQRFSFTWIWMQMLLGICLVVSIVAAVGSVGGTIESFRSYKIFQSRA